MGRSLAVTLVALLLVTQVIAAPVAASTTGRATTQRGVIVENRVLDRTPGTPGQVTVTYRYELPGSVVDLRLRVPVLQRDSARVVATDGFGRTDSGAFEWGGADQTPSVTVALSVPTDRMNDRGVDRSSFAFVFFPDTQVRWRYRGVSGGPAYRIRGGVTGPGVAVDTMAYAGSAEVITGTTVQGTEVSLVVAENATPAADPAQLATVARILVEDFRLGQAYDDTGVFVLPRTATPSGVTGQNLGDSYWIQGPSARLDTVETTLTHEFAHTRIGQFDGTSARWLTEATAEYYGYILALNQGSGDFSEFQQLLSAYHEEYVPGENPAVLTEPTSWEDSLANYQKGALVLAALDARIRNRTNGQHRLRDVLAVRFRESNNFDRLTNYSDFRRALVAVTDRPSLGRWLDRYATTEAVPPVPENPYRFVTRWGADPDRDTLTSERERAAGTNPFDRDTDNDGLRDFIELGEDLNASDPDTDGDDIADSTELSGPTNATDPDTDGDDVVDGLDAYPTDPSLTTPTPTPTPEPTATPPPTTTATVDDAGAEPDDGGDDVTDARGPGPGVTGGALAFLVAVLLLAGRRD